MIGWRSATRSRLAPLWQYLTERSATRRKVLIKLIDDVEHVGKKDDVVYVQPGHMRHDLYPDKKAVYALATDEPTVQGRRERVVRNPTNEQLVYSQLDQVVDRLTSVVLEISVPLRSLSTKSAKEDDSSNLITAEVISKFVKEKMRIDLSPTLLGLTVPIKETGNYNIPLKFIHSTKRDQHPTLRLKVEDKSEKD